MSSVCFSVYPLPMLIKLRSSMASNSNCKPIIVMTNPDGVISHTCQMNSAYKEFGAPWKLSLDGIGSCSGSLHSSECLPSHTPRQAVNMRTLSQVPMNIQTQQSGPAIQGKLSISIAFIVVSALALLVLTLLLFF